METRIEGHRIQEDRSGVGHCWQDIPGNDMPSAVREEIEGEILDGGRKSGEIVSSNGLHYRWLAEPTTQADEAAKHVF